MIVLYITFGQTHTHSHNGITLDKDCVGIIHCKDESDGRKLAFEWFGDKFATTYTEIDNNFAGFFPRGFIELN